MSYTKQTWETGDTITAAKLNHMEDGIAGGGGLIVTVTRNNSEYTMDKTAQEIYDSLKSGVPVFCSYENGTPTTQYTSDTNFDIITDIYGYNYQADITVVVLKSKRGATFQAYPCVALFQAEGLSDYPYFIGTVSPKDESMRLETTF